MIDNYNVLGYSWSKISTGRSHQLAIRSDGALFAWGGNTAGQIGVNDIVNRSSPFQIGSSSWSQVGAGDEFSVAIRSDGALFAWGLGTSGQLGNNVITSRSSPVQIGTSSWSIVSSGGYYNFGIDINNLLYAWGLGTSGQLGLNVATSRSSPTQVGSSSWTSVAAGGNDQNVAIKLDGTLFTWGSNSFGQLGDGSVVSKSSPVQITTLSTVAQVNAYATLTGQTQISWTQVSYGTSFALAISTVGRLYAWGLNNTGQLGTNDTINVSSPVPIGTSSWSAISAGVSTAAAITVDGKLFVWGQNNIGQLGTNDIITRSSPVQVGTSSWSVVSVGGSFVQAITNTGLLYAWGNNASGQLGITTITSRSSPVQIANPTGNNSWTSVSAGGNHTIAILTGGAAAGLYIWGLNNNGQLGTNDVVSRSSPVQLGASQWSAIAAGGTHTVALRSDNLLFTWGQGTNGQLGLNVATNRSSPVQVGTSSWTLIRAQDAFNSATINGTLFTWGYNLGGALGDNSLITKSSPVQIGSSSWSQVASGYGFPDNNAGITSGQLYTWGTNTFGQLGNLKSSSNTSSPTFVKTINDSFSIVSTGGGSSAAIRSDSLLFMWGLNSVGQLGDLSVISKSNPVQIGSYTQVALTQSATAVIANTGALFTWGQNNTGNLADGSSTGAFRSSPVQVGTNTAWQAISGSKFAGTNLAIWNNTLIAWGTNTQGQLGNNATVTQSVPVIVVSTGAQNPIKISNSSFSQVSAGYSHSLAIASNNLLFGWGNYAATVFTRYSYLSYITANTNNAYLRSDFILFMYGANASGQLGTNDVVTRSSPTQIGTNSWTLISLTSERAFAIKPDGGLYGWGNNTNGELGLSVVTLRSSPTQIGTSSFTLVEAGWEHTVAIDVNKLLYTWGLGTSGQLGNNAATSRSSPTQIGAGSWNVVVAGRSHTLAIDSTGVLFAWGANNVAANSGPLGDGTTISKSSPVQIGLIQGETDENTFATFSGQQLTSWSQVSSGSSHTLALKSDGSLWSWGNNAAGQLGTGTVAAVSSPVKIGTSSWSLISAGASHSVAIANNGLLYTWGLNNTGQLGTNDRANNTVPVPIGFTATAGYNSVSFNGSTDKLTLATNAAFNMGSGDFTVECWVYWNGTSTFYQNFIGSNSASFTGNATFFRVWGTGVSPSALQNKISIGNPTHDVLSAVNSVNNLSTNTWNHVAATRSSGIIRVFINGNLERTGSTDTSTYDFGDNGLVIGQSPWDGANGWYSGYISNARLIKGQALYTATFTPSTTPLTTTSQGATAGNVSLLTAQSSTFVDNSTNNFTITPNGTPGIRTFNPFGFTGTQNTSWSTVSAGATHTVAVTTTGALFTWGLNAAGQLGTVDVLSRSSPTQVGTSSYSLVSAGVSHTMVTSAYTGTTPGALFTFGNNTTGTLGDNTVVSKSSPVQITTITSEAVQLSYLQSTGLSAYSWSQISQGASHTMAIRSDGLLFGWGLNTSGQLGTAAVINLSIPTQIGTSSWSLISAGALYTIGLTTTNLLYVWGSNAAGQLGTNDIISRSSPVQLGTSSWTSLSAGATHTVAITTTGGLFTWGLGTSGQLGTALATSRSSPTQIGTSSWSSVSAGTDFSLATNTNKLLYSWGLNTSGQLGDLSAITKSSPVQIGTSSWNYVGAGGTHSVALDSRNVLWGWGLNTSGQLGLGDVISKSSPLQITTLFGSTAITSYATLVGQSYSRSWAQVTAGNSYYLALTTDGLLYGWGLNNVGQLGTNDITFRYSPIQIGTSSWTSVSADASNSVAIRADGIIFTWGQNTAGQLGTQDLVNRSSPTQLGTSSWSTVSAGNSFMQAIATTGALFAWGLGTSGQLGNNVITSRSSPVQIGTSSWSMVSAGGTHSLGISSNNLLYAWGLGTSGQLGLNVATSRSSPTQVGTSSWTSVSAGQTHSVAIDSNLNLYTWGFGTSGQLGDNTIVTKSSPVLIGTSTWLRVSAGVDFNTAITTQNNLFTWGLGTSGQLGDSTIVSKSSPTLIGTGNPAGYYSISFDGSSSLSVATANNVALSFGTGDYTIECWVNYNGGGSGDRFLLDNGNGAQFLLRYQGGTTLQYYTQSTVRLAYTVTLTIGTWYHIAVVKASGVYTLYLNGISVNTNSVSETVNNGSNNLGIGGVYTGGSTDYFGGYISNIRITKGQALYTSNFTPSTTPLTTTSQGATAGNISLLTAQSSAFVDNSSNAFTVTILSGSPFVSGIQPFTLSTTPSTYTNIVAGNTIASAVDTSAFLYTWGVGTSAELGNLRFGSVSSPTMVKSINDSWTSIGAGNAHTLGIRSDLPLYVFGSGTNGALGLGNVTNQSVPVVMPSTANPVGYYSVVFNGSTDYLTVTSNSAFTFGTGDFTIECWVYVTSLPTNTGATTDRFIFGGFNFTPAFVVFLYNNNNAISIWNGTNQLNSVGTSYGSSGTVLINTWTHIAWVRSSSTITFYVNGIGYSPQSLSTNFTASTTPYVGRSDSSADRYFPGYISNMRVVKGQALYTTTFTPSTTPLTTTSQGATASNVSLLTAQSSTFVDNSTNNFTITNNGSSQISSLIPFSYAGSGGLWTKVAQPQGTQLSAAVNNNGILYTWGTNTAGQIGNYSYNPPVNTNSSSPVFIKSVYESYTVLSAGNNTNAVIRRDGLLHAWGFNTSGQLGLLDTVNKSSPIQIGTSSWTQISAGAVNMSGLSNNLLYVWGQNPAGQIGDGTTAARSSPTQIGTSSWIFTNSNMMNSYTMAIANNRKLYAWGVNTVGILGLLSMATTFTSPTLVPSILGSAIAVTATQYSSFGLRSDGRLFAWGAQAFAGILGLNDTITRSNPTQIGNSSWTQIANVAGITENMYAINANGLLYGWGSNSNGSLAAGDGVPRSSPVQIGTFKWASISVGSSATASTQNVQQVSGVRNDNVLFTWGTTTYQPQTATVNRSSPVQVGTATNYITSTNPVSSITQIGAGTYSGISAGNNYSLAYGTNNVLYAWGAQDNSSTYWYTSPTTIGYSATNVSAGISTFGFVQKT